MSYNVVSTGSPYHPQRAQVVEGLYQGHTDGRSVWLYRSTHAHAEIEAAGFFTDGKRHGLKVGDALLNIAYSSAGSSAATWHTVSASTAAISAASPLPSSAFDQAYNVTVTPATT